MSDQPTTAARQRYERHTAEAERLIANVDRAGSEISAAWEQRLIGLAQVHATLAQTALTEALADV